MPAAKARKRANDQHPVLASLAESLDEYVEKIAEGQLEGLHSLLKDDSVHETPGQMWERAAGLFLQCGADKKYRDSDALLVELNGRTALQNSQGTIHVTKIDFRSDDTYWNGAPAACEVIPLAKTMLVDGYWKSHPLQLKLAATVDRTIELPAYSKFHIEHGSKRALAVFLALRAFLQWENETTAHDVQATLSHASVAQVLQSLTFLPVVFEPQSDDVATSFIRAAAKQNSDAKVSPVHSFQ